VLTLCYALWLLCVIHCGLSYHPFTLWYQTIVEWGKELPVIISSIITTQVLACEHLAYRHAIPITLSLIMFVASLQITNWVSLVGTRVPCWKIENFQNKTLKFSLFPFTKFCCLKNIFFVVENFQIFGK
jgi:hypothetical protein